MKKTTFLRYLEYEKRFSEHTIRAYQSDLEQFIDFTQQNFAIATVEEIKHTHIRSWMVELVSQGFSARTINRKLSTLKSYFRFLQKRFGLQHNPMLKITAPKTSKRLPSVVRASEMQQLLEHIAFSDDFAGVRDRLVLELLYATGMRRSELLQLTEKDINRMNRTVLVKGKGNKERLIPYGPALDQSLDRYLDRKNTSFPKAAGRRLILTDKGVNMYPKGIYNIVKKYLSMVTTVEQRSPHVLRHSFATHLSDNGADLNAVKTLLGHTNLAATQIYMHNAIEKLKEVYQQAHPKAKIDEDS